MKFTVSSTLFQRIVGKLGGVIQAKSTMPVLEHFMFDLVNNTLTATATDLNIWMQVSLDVKGEEDGQITIPAKRLMDTLRQLPDTDFEFAADTTTHRITLRTVSGEYNMTGDAVSQFPPVPESSSEQTVNISASVLQKIIQKTVFAVSQDEMRPAMNGVLLRADEGTLTAVATDGHRLVRYILKASIPAGLKRDIVLPVKTLNIVGKSIADEAIAAKFSKNYVEFAFAGTTIVSRLIEDPYPPFQTVIPAENVNDKALLVDRDQMIQAIRRVALYASTTTHQVRFDIAANEIRIAAADLDFGWDAKEKLPCTFSEGVLMIGFNAHYVVDLLTHVEGKRHYLNLASRTRPESSSQKSPKTVKNCLCS